MKIIYKKNNPEAAMVAVLMGSKMNCNDLWARRSSEYINIKSINDEPVIFLGLVPKLSILKAVLKKASSVHIYAFESDDTFEAQTLNTNSEYATPLIILNVSGCFTESIWHILNADEEPPAQVSVVIKNAKREAERTELNAFRYYKHIGFSAESAKKFLDEPLYSSDLKGEVIAAFKEKQAKRLSTKAFRAIFGDYATVSINLPLELIGDVLVQLKKKYKDVEFFCFISQNSDGIKCRLRSNNSTFDVGALARKFGGSGDKTSAIVTLSEQPITNVQK